MNNSETKVIEPAITFKLQENETPFLQINPNGDCYVKGEFMENNKDVFEAFKEWLIQAGFMVKETN